MHQQSFPRPQKIIRVIREIRVQNPYAPRLNKDIRVPRQKKNPCSPPAVLKQELSTAS